MGNNVKINLLEKTTFYQQNKKGEIQEQSKILEVWHSSLPFPMRDID